MPCDLTPFVLSFCRSPIFIKFYFWILCGILSCERGADVQKFADSLNLELSKWPKKTKCRSFLQDGNTLLNLPEDLLSVEQVGNEHPYGGGQEVLCQMLSVWLAVGHFPAKGEVLFKHLMTHVHQDWIHTGVKERRSRPPLLDIHHVVKDHEKHKGKTAKSCHIGQRP